MSAIRSNLLDRLLAQAKARGRPQAEIDESLRDWHDRQKWARFMPVIDDAGPSHSPMAAVPYPTPGRPENAPAGTARAAPGHRRKRRPTLVSIAKQAAKAGLEVARYEVESDGKITIVTGKPETTSITETRNEWDTVQ